jgi:hypothetical protein
MNCPRCQIEYNAAHWGECPHCGGPDRNSGGVSEIEGVIKTSTILISSDDGGVFGSIDEVPEPLRKTLVACTKGENSATIFIADKGGRTRIAAALANPSGNPAEAPRAFESGLSYSYSSVRGRPYLLAIAGFLAAGCSVLLLWLAISHLN